jgi:succinate-acetate transporter protein
MSFRGTTPSTTLEERRYHNGASDADGTLWRERTRLVLTPTAPPSILGLFGLAGATFIVAAYLSDWYGNAATPLFIFPFVALFGGLAQFVAGMFAYRARDGLATAVHGMWGTFFLAWGTVYLLGGVGAITVPAGVRFTEIGFWFVVLGAITWLCAVAALRVSYALTGVLTFLAIGSTLAAVAYLAASHPVLLIAGYAFIVAAVLAWYTAGAMMLEGTFRRSVLPVGKVDPLGHVSHTSTDVIEYPIGMPGAHAGQ